MNSQGVTLARSDPRYRMAHPTSPRAGEDWWREPRHPRIQYALFVAAQVGALLVALVAILALGAIAGAAIGVDMGPVR
jgi:hypothetical protein